MVKEYLKSLISDVPETITNVKSDSSGSITYCMPTQKAKSHFDFDISYIVKRDKLMIVSVREDGADYKKESGHIKTADLSERYKLFDYLYKKILQLAVNNSCTELSFMQSRGEADDRIDSNFLGYIVGKYHFSEKDDK